MNNVFKPLQTLLTVLIKYNYMAKANMLITYDPAHPGKARDEAKTLLEDAKESPEFADSEVDGVFLVRVSDPKKAVRKLAGVCKDEPERFNYTFKWVPVDRWCSSDMDDMSEAVKGLEGRIGDDESWKLDLSKRKYDKYSTTDLIMGLTENISKPNVDLKKPDKIVKVDIIGDEAAISLLEKDEYLDVQKLKK